MTSKNGNAQVENLDAPRTPACQSGVLFDCHSSRLAGGPQGEPGPFDRERSLALDTQQAALDAVAEGFVALRLAYQLTPENRYLPRALAVTVEAFGAAVGAVRELEREARL